MKNEQCYPIFSEILNSFFDNNEEYKEDEEEKEFDHYREYKDQEIKAINNK
ncbi:MAG: hypothetical protein V1688_03245 [bacterium]